MCVANVYIGKVPQMDDDKETAIGNIDIRPTKPTVKRDISSSLGTNSEKSTYLLHKVGFSAKILESQCIYYIK